MCLFRGHFAKLKRLTRQARLRATSQTPSKDMARAANEIASILNALHGITWSYTDRNGVPHRPYGNDYVQFERYMGRLLVLRGVMPEHSPYAFSEDPWLIYMREFGPVVSSHAQTQDLYVSTPPVPRPILQSSGPGRPAPHARARQPVVSSPRAARASVIQPSYSTALPPPPLPTSTTTTTAPVVVVSAASSDCHVRFASDLPVRPQGANGSGSGRSGRIPRWVN